MTQFDLSILRDDSGSIGEWFGGQDARGSILICDAYDAYVHQEHRAPLSEDCEATCPADDRIASISRYDAIAYIVRYGRDGSDNRECALYHTIARIVQGADDLISPAQLCDWVSRINRR
jgi:hypothetical protein